jgi:hypothetical protein
MRSINLAGIIEARKLDTNVVAELLFPAVKYPRLALNRILSGEAVLDADQISKLSTYTGISIGYLFSGGAWEFKLKPKDVVEFISGEYKAELNTKSWIIKVYSKKTLFHEEVIVGKNTPVSSILEYLDKLVINNP